MAYKIGLPIGHGENTYDDKGSKGIANDGTGKSWEEFWFNEKVGRYAHDRLKEHGFEVVIPQKWDANEVSLTYKSNLLNRERTDLNVAIHANAGVSSAEGACIFYWKGSAGGKKFADLWVKNFQEMCPEQGLHGNGQHVSQRGSWTNFHIIRDTTAVTDLIEHGFFTNADDLKNLKSDDFQRRCAEVVVKSVCEYFGVDYKDTKVKTIQTVTVKKENENLAKTGFKDVSKDAYYANAIKWLKENKILVGYGNGKFGVGDTLTREDFAVALYRALRK